MVDMRDVYESTFSEGDDERGYWMMLLCYI